MLLIINFNNIYEKKKIGGENNEIISWNKH